jgi:hypothetical protein
VLLKRSRSRCRPIFAMEDASAAEPGVRQWRGHSSRTDRSNAAATMAAVAGADCCAAENNVWQRRPSLGSSLRGANARARGHRPKTQQPQNAAFASEKLGIFLLTGGD